MQAMSAITGTDGNLLPSKTVSANSGAPVLNILPKHSVDYDSDEYASESVSSSESTEEENGFYYEVALTCTNDEGDQDELNIVFNFESESNYLDHAERGFDDFDDYFHDAITMNYPDWDYADEWEEVHLYGPEHPDHHEGVIVDVI